MDLEIVGEITAIEVIAVGTGIHGIKELRKKHGKGRWRKLKGIAFVRFASGDVFRAELHWYEAHGIGRRRIKIKRLIE